MAAPRNRGAQNDVYDHESKRNDPRENILQEIDVIAHAGAIAELSARPLKPEERLLLAVLAAGIQDARRQGRLRTTLNVDVWYDDARWWMLSRAHRCITDFESICDHFGLDADAVRERLGFRAK